jgi:homoserine dehydrogenase
MDENEPWNFHKDVDGLDLKINYQNKIFYIEVIFNGKHIYTDNKEASSNLISKILLAMSPDEKSCYYNILFNKIKAYYQYLSKYLVEIGQQTKGKATYVVTKANQTFAQILELISQNTLAPLEMNNYNIPVYVLIFLPYPKFEQDFKLLKENNYFQIKENGYLKWTKNKKALAEYFAYLSYGYPVEKNNKKNIKWKEIEVAFQEKNLRNHFRPAKSFEKASNDFNELIKLLKKQ